MLMKDTYDLQRLSKQIFGSPNALSKSDDLKNKLKNSVTNGCAVQKCLYDCLTGLNNNCKVHESELVMFLELPKRETLLS